MTQARLIPYDETDWREVDMGSFLLRYSDDLDFFGPEKLKSIARQAKAALEGGKTTFTGTHKGTLYAALMFTGQQSRRRGVVIVSKKRLEQADKASTSIDLSAKDGQHRHGGKTSVQE